MSQTHSPKISVVVPIYNVQDYLPECVDSILAQTLTDLEIILVDDGSPDNCPAIVDDYARRDQRIVAIHQVNGGYGKAVNVGFARACGEYVAIVESDDFLEPTMYEQLYAKATQYDADVAKSSFYSYRQDKKGHYRRRIYNEHPSELFPCPDEAFSLRDYPKLIMSHASIWSMIYRREFLQNNHLRVIETPSSAYQDFLFMTQVFATAQKIVVVKKPLYNWRLEREGNSTSQRGARLLQMPTMNRMALDVLRQKKLLSVCREEIYYHIFRANYSFLQAIQWQYKLQYFDELVDIYDDVVHDKTFCWRYFDRYQMRVMRALMANDLPGVIKLCRQFNWLLWRRSLISKRLPSDFGGDWQICLLGLQIGTKFDYNLYSWAHWRVGRQKAGYDE